MSNQNIDNVPTCEQRIKEYFQKITLISRFVFLVVIVLYLADLLFQIFFQTLFCSANTVYKEYQIWRIFSAEFVDQGIIALLISCYFLIPRASQHEREIGTARYGIFWVVNHTFLFLLFCLITLLLSVKFKGFDQMEGCGLIGMYMTELVYDCMKDPREYEVLPFINVRVRKIYYQFLVLLVFVVFGFPILLLLIGMLMGLIHRYHKLDPLFLLSDERAKGWETSCLFTRLKALGSFCPAVSQPTGVGVLHFANQNMELPNPQPVAFSGKGVQLGSDFDGAPHRLDNADFSISDEKSAKSESIASSEVELADMPQKSKEEITDSYHMKYIKLLI